MSLQDMLMQQVKNAIFNHTNQQNTGFDPSALINQLSGAASQGNLNANTVTNLIQNHADNQQHTGFDPSALINQVQGLFGQHQNAQGMDPYAAHGNDQQYGNVKSAAQDPYGDPADQGNNFGNVKSAAQDPYGDPADEQNNFGNVKPASEDPYGDPADEEPNRR